VTRDRGLVAIASFKLVKGALVVALGVGALKLLDPAAAARLKLWLSHLSLQSGQQFVERTLSFVSKLTGHAEVISVGAIVYGSLFLVEGIGLWRGKRWAEWLTVIATSVFIPFEIYELVKKVDVTRILALVVNVAVVVYLLIRIRHPRTQ
jgi:uncharacterized membrane protein (DUF2068 family)